MRRQNVSRGAPDRGPRGYYRGFDDLPRAAREVFADSKWLGMLQEWQIRQIPKSDDIVERLQRADRVMQCGDNASAGFPPDMMLRLTQILFYGG